MLEHEIHSKIAGNEYIILLHGFGGNSSIFYKQIELYKKYFNVITIHLPGHGNSPSVHTYKGFSHSLVAQEVVKTLDVLKIKKAHFIGVSLGSIIIHWILKESPNRVKSAILAGAMTKFNPFSSLLYSIGNLVKTIVPHLWIYTLFAYIIMPKTNHKKSRSIFIREAKKMNRKDFIGWFNTMKYLKRSYVGVPLKAKGIPKLYVSGREDHLFLTSLQKDILKDKDASMKIIENCGHVCNIEGYELFNQLTIAFLNTNKNIVRQIS
ncbi:pimeloyl-ACP methyl ester carboxylesterase [Salirhabdus euzebyi]|uniref:Pimeloyl-ACP methyl ester carboxylesterase n=1 Tax=Salirhabdus euzebyi TaxID=394506 RepID=A0A841Q4W3_9BACI|nr:alpha/beta hydrolase [Salirhabdus euzebyi]MBB6453382.1 pimeloyl-ACP methyl ester carboxylesterase [Salirhabdus euzebyi]